LAGPTIFASRIQDFLQVLRADVGTRLPGQRRFEQRAAGLKNGVTVSDVVVEEIQTGIRQSWTK
jgi:(2R)-3-sulfolactate dehydrogenase (NADP+)